MKFTLGWLKEHLDTDASLDDISARLTMNGHEVEGIHDRAAGLEEFVVARILEAKQHPDADRLRVCTVDYGAEEPIQVVCGAPNARTGLLGVFAREGLYIPGTGITLKKAEIRGVASSGMMVSEREMEISEDHDGIIEFTDEHAIGSSAVEALGLNDPVIEIGITPNRGDCLGVRGVARDLAASGLGTLKPLAGDAVPGTVESPIKVHIDLEGDDRKACPYFVGRYVKGVKNGESPKWLKDRLEAIGLRPISVLVDITNFMTFAYDRPLHVFDADKVTGDIHVRFAKEGETLLALNEKEYTLDQAMTVIADDAKAEALGGVMGGEESGCTPETVNVFVEAAYFDPVRTAATGRKLNLQSDARFRFERGIDPAFLIDGMEIATQMILDLCGGEASDLVVAGGEPDWQRTIDLRLERVKTLGGVDIPTDEVVRILSVLGFAIEQDGDVLHAAVPSWRPDIVGESCLVEEVVRIHGYEQIPAVRFRAGESLPSGAYNAQQTRRNTARRTLASRGLIEAVTYSFLPSAHADLFGGVSDGLRLVNPISSDLDVMRPSVLPNLIAAAGRNADRGVPNAALFEIGPQFDGPNPGDETLVTGGIRSGETGPKHWAAGGRAVDVFDAKADAMAVLEELGAPVEKLQTFVGSADWYHPGRAGELRLGPKNTLARFGEIHPRVLRRMDVKGPIVAFELFLDALPKPKSKGPGRPLLTLASLQPISRDFAFVMASDIVADDIIRAAKGADKALITDVQVFDVFAGGNLGDGMKSMAIRVILQPTNQTLTDEEIDTISSTVVDRVQQATGGKLRG